MKHSVTVNNQPGESLELYVDQPTTPLALSPLEALETGSSSSLPSYRPTGWKLVNAALDLVDSVTSGRAGVIQRLFSYLFFGGLAAVVNLIVFYIMFNLVRLPGNTATHNLIAAVVASEISIMANFMPNDYFTFRHLAGHDRSWSARCVRFHITSIVGALLTILIEFTLSTLLRVPALGAQAVALILVLFYNFSFHHIFTYRHVKKVEYGV